MYSTEACFVPTSGIFFRRNLRPPPLSSRVALSQHYIAPVPKRSPARRAPLAPIARADTTTREEELLSSLSTLRNIGPTTPLHQYRKKHSSEFSEASAAVTALEATGGFGATKGKLRSLLPGTWTLVLTNSKAVEANAGSITGLGSLPGARCTQVDVVLEKSGSARTVEKIKVWAGLMNGENSLLGKWRLTGKKGTTLEVTYAKALLMGKTTVRADSKAVLECSYCSDKVRIGRSESGDFYVFTRS